MLLDILSCFKKEDNTKDETMKRLLYSQKGRENFYNMRLKKHKPLKSGLVIKGCASSE